MYSTTVEECGVSGDCDFVTNVTCATWSVLRMGLPHFQHTAASFLHRCKGIFY
jgi:hypothetical protein